MKRFYISENAINDDNAIISGIDAHHIKNVLRLGKDHVIQLILPNGHSYAAKINSLSNEIISTDIIEPLEINQPKSLHITVAQSMLKDKKNDTLIRQTTELGVDRWISFISERSIARPSKDRMKKKINRWQQIARSAAQQCQRQRITEICEELLDISDVFSLIHEKDTIGYFFWEKSTKKLEEKKQVNCKSVILIFGPEGGFTDKEAETAENSGYYISSLGPRILRAETATISGLSLIQYLYGDLR